MASSPAAVSGRPTLETYGELQRAYEHFNAALFDAALPSCLITLQRKKRVHGYFSRNRFGDADGNIIDEIALNPGYFSLRSIEEILSTLVHEMVHSWQFHCGTPSRPGYHNSEWAAQMEAVGLMPSHNGAEGGRRVGQKVTHYIMPDGPFAIACEALLTQSFKLSWFDRFPPERPATNLAGLNAAGLNPDGSSPLKFAPAPSSVRSNRFTYGVDPFDDDPPDEGGMLSAGICGIEFLIPGNVPGGGLREGLRSGLVELPDDSVNRSLRVRFRCPSCGSLAWGKPGLNIWCGQDSCCGERFVASA